MHVESRATVTVCGGARGGGKTHGTLMRPVFKGAGGMGALDDPDFTGMLFRREKERLRGPGRLWDCAKTFYRQLGANTNENHMSLKFPSGAQIKLDGLKYEDDTEKHRGAAYCWIGLEEGTEFTESQFHDLLRCNRPANGCEIEPWIDITCNPNPDSWLLELIRWWIWPEDHPRGGFPRSDRAGKLRWMTFDGDQRVWIDQIFQGNPADWRDEDGNPGISVTYIPSTVDDNPALLETDPTYRSKLMSQRYVQVQRDRWGNWFAADSRGFFARGRLRWVDPHEAPEVAHRLWYWDLAATHRDKSTGRNMTAGVLAAHYVCPTCHGWRWIDPQTPCGACNLDPVTHEAFEATVDIHEPRRILLLYRLVTGELGPGDVQQLVRRCATETGVDVPIYLEEESAGSGLTTTDVFTRRVMPDFEVYGDKPQGKKEVRANDLAALAEFGLVWVVVDQSTQLQWQQAFRDFPGSGRDIIDATTGAERALWSHEWPPELFWS